jgi:hypothetical protein
MKWGDSPRAVAEAADVIFVMVTDSKSLDAVSSGPDGFLAGLATARCRRQQHGQSRDQPRRGGEGAREGRRHG